MPVNETEKLLGSTGLAELIGRIKAAIAAAGAPPDGVTIDENEDGELEAVVDQEGGVTSYATHLAAIVTADETTITKSEENVMGLKPSGIQPEHLSNGCVTTDKIASSAVTSDKLADGCVETSAIADGAVTPEKISDLAELRGEMGLGYTLGALPVSSGGTGVTSIDELSSLFGLVELNNNGELNISSTYCTAFSIPQGIDLSDFKLMVVITMKGYYVSGAMVNAYIGPAVILISALMGNSTIRDYLCVVPCGVADEGFATIRGMVQDGAVVLAVNSRVLNDTSLGDEARCFLVR